MRCLCALLVLLPSLALADYKSDYREGLSAVERQDWARVDALMRKAMAEEPEPQARIRLYGQVFVPYVPKFYLGLAAFNRKDCATAVSLLEDARNASVMRGQRLEERQQTVLRTCRAQLASAAVPVPAPTPAQPAAAPAEPRPTPPKPVASAQPKPTAPAATTVPAFDAARAQAVQVRLDRIDAALVNSARLLGDAALADARANWQRQLDPLNGQSRQARGRLNAARQTRDAAVVAELERSTATLESASRKIVQGIEGARVASAAANRAREDAQARQALATQVRGRLQPLAEAYLGGDFTRAAQWADESALRSVPQAHAEALLLRAAARFELYVLGGEQDLGQVDLIRNDVRAARRISDNIQPSEMAYSPRFRALFASTR